MCSLQAFVLADHFNAQTLLINSTQKMLFNYTEICLVFSAVK